ncbi:alanine--tRNA ligase, partial [candidate division bacterium WOR-3 4484_18]
IRRAVWAGYNLGVKEPFLYRLIGAVINSLKEAYPEITTKREQVGLIIKSEEERFLATLERGKKVFEELLRDTLSSEKPVIPGDKVFKLYDTYGLPPEMTRELASTHGVAVDMAGFEQYLEEQKQQARSKAKFLATGSWISLQETGSEFVGYNFNRIEAHIIKYRQLDDNKVDVVLDKTPFYAESGGQVGDKGRIYNEDVELEVYDTQYEGDLIIHRCKIIRGGLPTTRPVLAEIDTALRKAIAQHHTATHLLQAALKRVLGDHVRQEGSLVAPTYLRFDFTHYKGLTDREIEKVETLVNEWIQSNLPVEVYHTTFKQAVDDGVIYIVGEEYKDPVRVVKIGDISRELCGTHLNATGEIGMFKILNESSIHAGIRRIEAVAGMNAWRTVYDVG